MPVVVINEEKTQTHKNRYNILCFITNFLEIASKIKNRKAFIRTDIVLKHGVCDLKEVKNIAEEVSLEEYKKAYREVVSEEEKRDFLVHLVVYVLVNAMLIAINFIYCLLYTSPSPRD